MNDVISSLVGIVVFVAVAILTFLALKGVINQWFVPARIRDLRRQLVERDARNDELLEDIEKLRQFIRDLQDSQQAVPSDASSSLDSRARVRTK